MFKTAYDFADTLNKAFEGTSYRFEVMAGSKYYRVVAVSHGSRSAYCFIDHEGNIYKTASWKAPAKGVRATLQDITQEQIDKIRSVGYATTSWLYR